MVTIGEITRPPGDIAEILCTGSNLPEVALGKFRDLATIKDLACQKHVAISLAKFNEFIDKLNALLDAHITPAIRAVSTKRFIGGFNGQINLCITHLADSGQEFLRAWIDGLKRGVHRAGNFFAIDKTGQRLTSVTTKIDKLLRSTKGCGSQGANLGRRGSHISG